MYDVALIELALEVVDDIGVGGHVGRYEDVGPVVGPSGIALIVVGRRRYSLQPLSILFSCLSHFASRPILFRFVSITTGRLPKAEKKTKTNLGGSVHKSTIHMLS